MWIDTHCFHSDQHVVFLHNRDWNLHMLHPETLSLSSSSSSSSKSHTIYSQIHYIFGCTFFCQNSISMTLQNSVNKKDSKRIETMTQIHGCSTSISLVAYV